MASACQTSMTLVIDACAVKAYHRDYSAEKQIGFFVFFKLIQKTSVEKSVVSMVVYGTATHFVHKLIEEKGTAALKEAVRVPVGAHAVDYVGTVIVGGNHIVHGIYVVLTVTVNAYCYIGVIFYFHES